MKKITIFFIALFLLTNITFAEKTSNQQIQQKVTNILSNYEQQLTDVGMEKEEVLFYNNKKILEKAVKESQPLIKELENINNNNLSDKEKDEIKHLTSKFGNLKKMSESYINKDKKIQNIDININKRIDFLCSNPNTKDLKEIITKLKDTQKNNKLSNFQKFKILEKADNIIIDTATMPNYCSLGLKINGDIVLLKNYSNKNLDFSSWTNIIQLTSFENHVLALKEDGTVLSFGENKYGECNTANWKNIKLLRSSLEHTIGLKKDGTVVATGRNDFGQCNVSGWKNITRCAAGALHTIGLKKDGTVIATGRNDFGQCNVSGWKNIIKFSIGADHTVGLKEDGTVVATGKNDFGQCNVSGWKNIKYIMACDDHTIGLQKDGKVVATGNNELGQCDVSDWTDIVDIGGNPKETIGIKANGAMITTNKDKKVTDTINDLNSF